MEAFPRGSEWHRWDVHIHAPGTILNDQFPQGSWDDFTQRINDGSPSVIALGITDYLGIDCYVEARKRWLAGQMPGIRLLFPNTECRLSVRTEKGQGINIHLLFCPDDADHIKQIEWKLRLLTFQFKGQKYTCCRDDFVRFGAEFDPSLKGDSARHAAGVKQFKIDFQQLQEWYRDEWVERNCLLAVAAAASDGTSGLQKDSAFAAFRKEIERFAHIIFSGNPSDRTFWLGDGTLKADQLRSQYGGLKPCLHGSDAHSLDDVLNPKEGRLCWIRSEPTFEGLRQVLFEPRERVAIGPDRPSRAQKNWLRSIRLADQPWFPSEPILLNEGMVSIIGPRGSGKTALVDFIAFGADAFDDGPASFLGKARPFVEGVEVSLEWAHEEMAGSRFLGCKPTQAPSVRYLSQQFVEQLCSAEGATERLIEEIEAVVFSALDETDRGEGSSFSELRDKLLDGSVRRVAEMQKEIAACSHDIGKLQAAKASLPTLREQMRRLDSDLKEIAKSLGVLVVKGKEEKAKTLLVLQAEATTLERTVGELKSKERRLTEIKRDVEMKARSSAELFSALKAELLGLGIREDEIDAFQVKFPGDVEAILSRRLREIEKEIKLRTLGSEPFGEGERPLVLIRKEIEALQKEIGGDTAKQKQYVELQKKQKGRQQERDKVEKEIKRIEGADIKVFQERRMERYLEIFDELSQQKGTLTKLYTPLDARLDAAPPEQKKLKFYVRQTVDMMGWAERGESLLDLRKKSMFQERGMLEQKAEEVIGEAWRTGDRARIESGMSALVELFKDARRFLAPTATLANLADWIFSTEHIRVTYGIRYDGIEIERLSPGARGIVLLILYLALDENDDRPLIIDQPEENLDPQSVYDVLVGFFREARRRRQVIIVTHNPNLVVNTDADQIIVASSERIPSEQLPRFKYESGGLENRRIMRRVCEILEGGERAFLQRARRYGLNR